MLWLAVAAALAGARALLAPVYEPIMQGDGLDHMRVRGADPAAVGSGYFNVLEFGAVGDGKTNDTQALQKTIDACVAAGGGTVLLPGGYTFLSGSLFLGSNMSFYVSYNATLLGSQVFTDYPMVYSRFAGTMMVGHAALVNAGFCEELSNSTEPGDNCLVWSRRTNTIIQGGGTIDGQGSIWWEHCNPICPDGSNNTQRPSLLGLLWVAGLTIDNVALLNSPMWTTHPIFSSNVLIANLNISAPANSSNTDGIDPDSCTNVYIADSVIGTGGLRLRRVGIFHLRTDDCIAIKSGKDLDGRAVGMPSSGILVEHMVFLTGHGVSIGSEMSGNVTDVVFRNSTCTGTNTGARVKTMRGRGGTVSNVLYENFVLSGVGQAISIDMNYQPAPPTNASATPTFRDITIQNFTSVDTLASAGEFLCLPESPCTNMTLDAVTVSGSNGYTCQNAFGTMADNEPVACLQNE